MYEVVVTEGLVVGRRDVGEANQLIALLTRDRGLLYSSTRSSRVEVSKLRYGLQLLSQGRFSLVRGKREWRLVGVQHAHNEFLNAQISPTQRAAAGRISKLLMRLVAGEEHTPKLFDDVAEGLALFAQPGLPKAQLESIEVVLVLRILSRLGYLPATPALAPYVENAFSIELAAEAAHARGLLIKTINESLGATGL